MIKKMMQPLVYSKEELNKGKRHKNSRFFKEFKHNVKEAIEISNKCLLAISSKDFSNYDACHRLEFLVENRGRQDCGFGIREMAGKLYKRPPLIVSELTKRLKLYKQEITNIINSDSEAKHLGTLSHLIEDLEECMKYNNFYRFFFLLDDAREATDDLGCYEYKGQYFDVQSVKRVIHKKLNLLENLIIRFHPGVVSFWETIRHNIAMEDVADEMVDAQESLADANWAIANSQEDLVEATHAHVIATLGIIETNKTNTNSYNDLVDATLCNMGANLLVARELNIIRKVQTAGTIISAYEAYQLSKIKKKLLE